MKQVILLKLMQRFKKKVFKLYLASVNLSLPSRLQFVLVFVIVFVFVFVLVFVFVFVFGVWFKIYLASVNLALPSGAQERGVELEKLRRGNLDKDLTFNHLDDLTFCL